MKIVQLMPTISFGDAVSNDAIALKKAIEEMGYMTNIYAENIDTRLPKGVAASVKFFPSLSKKDIVIYHLSTGTQLNYTVDKLSCRKIMIYHNITPAHFFAPYNLDASVRCAEGVKGAKYLASKMDYVLADSEFNKNQLVKMGYNCAIDVLPILISFKDYEKKPDEEIIKRYDDSWINIIFTGRIAPNKKQEDVIATFYYYKKFINPRSRLFLVGSGRGMENYENRLKAYVKELNIADVYFTGHVKFDELLAYYRVADIFLCMSEHEGFCVPLVESMFFDVPIVAYNSCAVGETLGGSGFLINEKNYIEVAEIINLIGTNKKLHDTIVANQRMQLHKFEYSRIISQFKDYMKGFIEKHEG